MQICRFPKKNNLASASRLRVCGESATVRTTALARERGKTFPVETVACLGHAVENAVSKVRLPPTFLDLNEMLFLDSKGALDVVEKKEIGNFKAKKYFFRGGMLHKTEN